MAEPAHQHWNAEALWQRLQPLLPGLSVEVVAHADSTNTRLLERARAASGDPNVPITRPGQLDARSSRETTPHGRRQVDLAPVLLVAEHQTRGRGRLGRDWQSSAASSLTFSLALPLAPHEWSGLSLAVGLAIAEALDPPPASAAAGAGGAEAGWAPHVALKWPNDLWLFEAGGARRKLGGILIETVTVGRRRMCVIGVGLNVRPQVWEGTSAACVQEFAPGLDAPAVLARVAEPLARELLRFEREGFGPRVADYARRDMLLGQTVVAGTPEGLRGVAEGVDASGALCLRVGTTLHRIVSGEVSVRLAEDAAGAAAAGAA